jgi:FixJ family two-component response regulator
MKPAVFLVDDDEAVRDALGGLLRAQKFDVASYASAEEFLASSREGDAGCIVLDLNLPGIGGIDLQARLAARGIDLPIIFLTGYGDVPSSVRALKAGAVDFLQKPVAAEVLLDRVRAALTLDAERKLAATRRADARARYDRLTPREREVMALVVAGHASKAIAEHLHISRRTVEVHRGRMMDKLAVKTVFELAELARLFQAPRT